MTELLLTKEKINCLVYGYCQINQCRSLIPIDIIKQCLSFYDQYLYLNITKQDINKIITEFSFNCISTPIYTFNVDDKLELSLCTYLVNMEGILIIDEVKVMLVPFYGER